MRARHNARPDPLTIGARRLEDRVVFITGATSGIGAAAARRFAAEGARIMLGGRRPDRLQGLVAELEAEGHDAAAIVCDVTDEADVRAAIAATVGRFGRLDGALNNAGKSGLRVPIEELPSAHFDEVIAPGPTRTEMYESDRPTLEQQIEAAAHLPMRQLALPDDIARAALFLLSDESRWTTGTVLASDGGIVAGISLAPVAAEAPGQA